MSSKRYAVEVQEWAGCLDMASWNSTWCVQLPNSTREPYVVHAFGHPVRIGRRSLCDRAEIDNGAWQAEPVRIRVGRPGEAEREIATRHCRLCEKVIEQTAMDLAWNGGALVRVDQRRC